MGRTLNDKVSGTTAIGNNVVEKAIENQDPEYLDKKTENYKKLLLKIAERDAKKD